MYLVATMALRLRTTMGLFHEAQLMVHTVQPSVPPPTSQPGANATYYQLGKLYLM